MDDLNKIFQDLNELAKATNDKLEILQNSFKPTQESINEVRQLIQNFLNQREEQAKILKEFIDKLKIR